MIARAFAFAAALLALACGDARGGYDAGGVVRGLRPEEGQITIEHGEIEDLMPAMTMSFDVDDPALLEGLEDGEYIEFHLVHTETGAYVIDEIVRFDPDAAGSSGGGTTTRDTLLEVGAAAPDFTLVDQEDESLSLAALRGEPVLIDFVFTRCPGPCPVLTGIHRDVREGLSPADRERVHSVSISLDPAYDTPEVLRAFLEARKIDGTGWSFVTGDVETVEAVVQAYGVGSTREPDGEIIHSLATFLIDGEGRVVERYLGVRHAPETIRADVEALLAAG